MKPVPFIRRLWFAWTLVELAGTALIILGAIALMAFLSAELYRSGRYGSGTVLLTIALSVAGLLFFRAAILRRSIRLGIRGELRRRNCCPHCAYDLRASTIRCPECGWVFGSENIEV